VLRIVDEAIVFCSVTVPSTAVDLAAASGRQLQLEWIHR
jgi:hypothetical protein